MKTPRLKPDLETHLQNGNSKTFGAAGSDALQKLYPARCSPGSRQSGHIGISAVPQQTHAHTPRGTRSSSNGWPCICLAVVAVPRQSTKGVDLQVHCGLRLGCRLEKPTLHAGDDERARQALDSARVYDAVMGSCSAMGTQSHLADWRAAEMTRREDETCSDTTLVVAGTYSRRRSPKDNCDVGATTWDNGRWMIPSEQSRYKGGLHGAEEA